MCISCLWWLVLLHKKSTLDEEMRRYNFNFCCTGLSGGEGRGMNILFFLFLGFFLRGRWGSVMSGEVACKCPLRGRALNQENHLNIWTVTLLSMFWLSIIFKHFAKLVSNLSMLGWIMLWEKYSSIISSSTTSIASTIHQVHGTVLLITIFV